MVEKAEISAVVEHSEAGHEPAVRGNVVLHEEDSKVTLRDLVTVAVSRQATN